MTYCGRMEDDGWSPWLAVMLYILIWLVSARLPVPSVHRVGGRRDAESSSPGRGGNGARAAVQVECSPNQNHIFSWDNTHPSKASPCTALPMPSLPRPSPATSLPTSITSISPSTQAHGGPAGCFHSNSSSMNGSFSQPTKLGIKAFPMQHHLNWVLALDLYLGHDLEIHMELCQVTCPLTPCTTKQGNRHCIC